MARRALLGLRVGWGVDAHELVFVQFSPHSGDEMARWGVVGCDEKRHPIREDISALGCVALTYPLFPNLPDGPCQDLRYPDSGDAEFCGDHSERTQVALQLSYDGPVSIGNCGWLGKWNVHRNDSLWRLFHVCYPFLSECVRTLLPCPRLHARRWGLLFWLPRCVLLSCGPAAVTGDVGQMLGHGARSCVGAVRAVTASLPG